MKKHTQRRLASKKASIGFVVIRSLRFTQGFVSLYVCILNLLCNSDLFPRFGCSEVIFTFDFVQKVFYFINKLFVL
jgi:hypothetical protein